MIQHSNAFYITNVTHHTTLAARSGPCGSDNYLGHCKKLGDSDYDYLLAELLTENGQAYRRCHRDTGDAVGRCAVVDGAVVLWTNH